MIYAARRIEIKEEDQIPTLVLQKRPCAKTAHELIRKQDISGQRDYENVTPPGFWQKSWRGQGFKLTSTRPLRARSTQLTSGLHNDVDK